jgi:ribulose-5-phosphate 4-epimerase/fuculose-1-phosphate aldolase
MSNNGSGTQNAELTRLRELSARIGADPLLTQASTGNTSIKLGDVLWIKASGKWLADAKDEEILVPLDLKEVRQCMQQKVDPAEIYACASIETAMHAVLPHAVVLHVHSVNTIAWAVRQDAPRQLVRQLDGLHWRWVPYVPSGLPLARAIQRTLSDSDANVLVLGNHGLVLGAENCEAAERLLLQVEQRLGICPRPVGRIGYRALELMAQCTLWELPDEETVHALATDPVSQAILSGGILFPCQSIFSESSDSELFRAIPCLDSRDECESRYSTRPFLIMKGCGVIVSRTMTSSQRAMMSGLAQVVQRIDCPTRIHYLTDEEVAYSARTIASRYQDRDMPSQYSIAP